MGIERDWTLQWCWCALDAWWQCERSEALLVDIWWGWRPRVRCGFHNMCLMPIWKLQTYYWILEWADLNICICSEEFLLYFLQQHGSMCSSSVAFILLNIGMLWFKYLCRSVLASRSSCCIIYGSVCSLHAASNDCWIDWAVRCGVVLSNIKFQLAVLDLPCSLNSELYYE